ncbi:MAG: DUF1501 domain-containing protein [Planctomycetota bacterium]
MSDLHLDPSKASAWTRRAFLERSLVFSSAALTVPAFVQRSAMGIEQPAMGMGSVPGVPEERILVILQLGGGNDGLNTVIPHGFDEYHNARPQIRIRGDQALGLGRSNQAIGLHPALEGVKELYDDGLASIVQGVGYPNPNRSHFKSMDIWHTADTSGTGDGWIGRYVDSECCGYGKGESGTAESNGGERGGGRMPAPVAIGRTAPLAMIGPGVKPISFESADLFKWTGEDIHPALVDPYEKIVGAGQTDDVAPDSNAAFLMRTSLDARVSSDTIRRAVSAEPLVRYPGSDLARQLQMVSGMVRAGMKTRVYFVTLGGFDTHAGQGGANGRHANLMRQLGDSVRAFYRDLQAQGNDGRVLTMCFSEFGRRVGQNASGGTDHGTAAPVMLFGPMVASGVLNAHPSMRDLDDGDLKFTVDFRTVYAGILEDWMGNGKSREILAGRYKAAPVIARRFKA